MNRAGHGPAGDAVRIGERIGVSDGLGVPAQDLVTLRERLYLFSVGPVRAQAAKQMGTRVAHNILARIDGRETTQFRYTDLGTLAAIGRHSAIAQLPWLRFSGLLAWLFWVALHIYFLIGFRSRIIVIINWGWAYFTHSRGARIILGKDEVRDTDGRQEKSTVQG